MSMGLQTISSIFQLLLQEQVLVGRHGGTGREEGVQVSKVRWGWTGVGLVFLAVPIVACAGLKSLDRSKAMTTHV